MRLHVQSGSRAAGSWQAPLNSLWRPLREAMSSVLPVNSGWMGVFTSLFVDTIKKWSLSRAARIPINLVVWRQIRRRKLFVESRNVKRSKHPLHFIDENRSINDFLNFILFNIRSKNRIIKLIHREEKKYRLSSHLWW